MDAGARLSRNVQCARMFGLSLWEIALILVVALLVLGPERMPKMLREIGKGMRELRRASSGLREAIDEPLEELRKPLQDIRDELTDTVYRAERDIRDSVEEVAAEEDAAPVHSPDSAEKAAPSLAEGGSPAADSAAGRAPPIERQVSRGTAPLPPKRADETGDDE